MRVNIRGGFRPRGEKTRGDLDIYLPPWGCIQTIIKLGYLIKSIWTPLLCLPLPPCPWLLLTLYDSYVLWLTQWRQWPVFFRSFFLSPCVAVARMRKRPQDTPCRPHLCKKWEPLEVMMVTNPPSYNDNQCYTEVYGGYTEVYSLYGGFGSVWRWSRLDVS